MPASPFGLADMAALLWAPSSPMADAAHSPFLQPDAGEPQEGGGASLAGGVSPPLPSPSLSSSPPPFYSPPPSPVLFHGDKPGMDLLSLSWLDQPGQLTGREDMSLDWMAERMDLSELDLDSLIGSCSEAEPQVSAEDLLAFDCPMGLDPQTLPPFSSLPPVPDVPDVPPVPSVLTVDDPDRCEGQEVPSSPLSVPEPQEELEIKSEPRSPSPPASPSFPAFTLDLGSEVDVLESEVKPVLVPEATRIVLSLSPTRIVLVLAPRGDPNMAAATGVVHNMAATEVVHNMAAATGVVHNMAAAATGVVHNMAAAATEVVHHSPPAAPHRSTRSRPYPEPGARPPSTTKTKSPGTDGGRTSFKAPKDKKQKKMEQNKTAATRYRQKKKMEQDALLSERLLLERRNLELSEKAESMAREIQYLKELMEEVRVARIKTGLGAAP